MSKYPNLILAIVFIVVTSLASLQGQYVNHLRKAETFYRWIFAAAANARLFDDWDKEYEDQELLQRLVDASESLLDDATLEEEVTEGDKIARFSEITAISENDQRIWQLAKGPELEETREEFLSLVREQKLQFTKFEGYVENVHIFNLFFGFRKVAANFLWIQVDTFWHKGYIHRVIPMMKTCVTLDPAFVDAYLLGSWHLAYNATAKMQPTPQKLKHWNERHQVCIGEKEKYYYIAVDFLRDGIRNNYRDYRLYFDLGYGIYSNKLEDWPNAVKYLEQAIRQPHERWVPRQLYRCLMMNKQYKESLAGWEDYQSRFPDNDLAHETGGRFIARNRGHIFEAQAGKAQDDAAQATDAAAKAAALQKAQMNLDKAYETWTQLDEPYGVARKLRLDAIRLIEQERFMEAVALLDKARWESNDLWEEASNLIIDVKLQAGLPLSMSEKKAVERNSESDLCPGMPSTGMGV
jgi:tetratricopeptide (TPR) repeat protein